MMFQRILIANRGEIAVRVIRACREMGIESVAVFSDPDAAAPHVALADSAGRIGPAAASESYLSIEAILSGWYGSIPLTASEAGSSLPPSKGLTCWR